MPRKQNLKLSVPLPNGVALTKELEEQALAAVKDVLHDLEQAAALAQTLEAQGFEIGVEELLKRKKNSTKKVAVSASSGASNKTAKTKKATSTAKGKGKRVVLTTAQKKKVVELLKEGKKARQIAEKYGVSGATVNNLKREAGLTKPSAAQEKVFAERKKAAEQKTATKQS